MSFPEALLSRLSTVFEPQQLADLVKACENARDAGNGFASVEIVFKNFSPVELRGSFTVKSPDQEHVKIGRAK